MIVVWFVGDPRGYRVDDSKLDEFSGWVKAEHGNTGRTVTINLDLAYLAVHQDEA